MRVGSSVLYDRLLMSNRRRAIVTGVMCLGLGAASASLLLPTAEAQPSTIAELKVQPETPPGRKLEAKTRLTRLNSATRIGGGNYTIVIPGIGGSSGSSSSSSSSSSGGGGGPLYHLTPETPRPNPSTLTRIAGAKPLHFEVGATNDGVFRMLNGGTGAGDTVPKIQMHLVTEASKVYVADCTIDPATPSSNAKVRVSAGSAPPSEIPIVDSHIFAAFQAGTGVSTPFALELLDRGTIFSGLFYGCDIFKSQ